MTNKNASTVSAHVIFLFNLLWKVSFFCCDKMSWSSSKGSASDFSADDSQQDPDFEPSFDLENESTSTSNSIAAETDASEIDRDINIAFNLGRSRNLSLKRLVKCSKSRPKLWENFGTMQYKGKTISKVADKIYCQTCFDNGSLKR